MSASTGTLVAAGLESAGYGGQSVVLASFTPILLAGAVLIFVLMSAKSLLSMVTEGNFVEALKLLAYPILVVFCLQTTTQSNGAEWQFGSFKGDPEKLKAYADNTAKANVSLPFELFNRFVSGASQLGIGLILNNPISGTVLFSVRQQLLDSILNVELVSSGLRNLVHEGLQGKCGTWMDASRKIARGNRDPIYQGTPDYNNAVSTYNKFNTEPSIRLQTTGPSYNYVLNLLSAINAAGPARTDAENLVRSMCDNANGVLTPDGRSAQDLVDAPISCSQVWCWSGLGLVLEARTALEEAVSQTVGQNETYKSLAPDSKAYILQQILQDLAKKISPDDDSLVGFDNDPSILPVVIAGYLLKKELNRGPRGTVYGEFAESSGVGISAYQSQETLTDSDKSTLREFQSDYGMTVSAANQMLALAYSLPYLQGALLFALAVLFPFFVITTGITRDAGGIFFWAGAWIWVKSWDLGWAVIMLIDQLIWEFMPHRSIYMPVAEGIHSPITVMESAFDTDPTYSLSTYYLLISMLLISIPTITGQLFLKGSQSMTQILFGGVQRYGAGPSAAIENKKANKAYEYWKNNPEISLADGPAVLPRPTSPTAAPSAAPPAQVETKSGSTPAIESPSDSITDPLTTAFGNSNNSLPRIGA